MIFYFSGTGNSQWVALQLAKRVEESVVSINRHLRSGERAAFDFQRPLVFVAPTYAWRLPKLVERWILETDFSGSQDAYFILTCGGSCGNAAAYAQKLCAKKKLRFCGLVPVVMPENYLALFPTPDEATCQSLIEAAGPVIDSLAQQLQAGRPFAAPTASLVERVQSGPVNPLFYRFFVHDKGFTVSDRCVSCGKCALRCPQNNIDLSEGKPQWKGRCTHCMACIGGCPTQAIEYGSHSRGRHRHYIMNDELCWGNGGEAIE